MQLPYQDQNDKAIATIEQSSQVSLKTYFETRHPAEAINYLRLLGFRCALCGHNITEPTLRYFGYASNTLCYDCQRKQVTIPAEAVDAALDVIDNYWEQAYRWGEPALNPNEQ